MSKAEHPLVVLVYEITADPADKPVTMPAGFTAAIAGAALDQYPPVVLSVNVLVAPAHTVPLLPIAVTVGVAVTVTADVVAL